MFSEGRETARDDASLARRCRTVGEAIAGTVGHYALSLSDVLREPVTTPANMHGAFAFPHPTTPSASEDGVKTLGQPGEHWSQHQKMRY